MAARLGRSARVEEAISRRHGGGDGDGERVAEIVRLGTRLVLQRAVRQEGGQAPAPRPVPGHGDGPEAT